MFYRTLLFVNIVCYVGLQIIYLLSTCTLFQVFLFVVTQIALILLHLFCSGFLLLICLHISALHFCILSFFLSFSFFLFYKFISYVDVFPFLPLFWLFVLFVLQRQLFWCLCDIATHSFLSYRQPKEPFPMLCMPYRKEPVAMALHILYKLLLV